MTRSDKKRRDEAGAVEPGQVDWPAVRRRLALATDAVQEALEQSPETGRRLLADRARRLARPAAIATVPRETVDVLCFEMAGERFAVETGVVKEVTAARLITPLPGAPARLVGVMACRGELLPIFDLSGGSTVPPEDTGLLVVLGRDRAEAALRVTAVTGVERLDVQGVTPPAEAGDPQRLPVQGVTPDMRVVLDGHRLLESDLLRLQATG